MALDFAAVVLLLAAAGSAWAMPVADGEERSAVAPWTDARDLLASPCC